MSLAEPFVILDDARPGQDHLTVFSGLTEVISASRLEQVPVALAALNQAHKAGRAIAGYFSYELGYALEAKLLPLMPKQRSLPLLWFGCFSDMREIDGPEAAGYFSVQAVGRSYAGPLRYEMSESDYTERFIRAKDYILAGDVYQINLTFPASFRFLGDPLALYARLRPRGRAGYGGIVADGERHLLSLSPELFFESSQGSLVSRPMKGTAPRSVDEAEDETLKRKLAHSEKDRAENLMIVDLIRNDLSHVTKAGSVRVDDLFKVETYPTVHQMISTVRGELNPSATSADIVRALFPCGSVTGTPKIHAMEIIKELEIAPRGLYCGAIGAFFPDGTSRFNVAIRTLTIKDGEGSLGIGGAVVADSESASEYRECLIKARFFSEERPPIGLIETLRYDSTEGFVRLPLHLARMQRSAEDLGIVFNESAAREALKEAAGDAPGQSRMRLALSETGQFECTKQPLGPAPSHWTYAVSKQRIQSGDRLLRYKVDWRELYDGEYARLHAERHCDEVLFLNERGEIAEGSRTNVFARIGEDLVTPPLSSGVLDGCLRRALLDDPASRCVESVLTPSDLARAKAVYFGNSLRGVILARPV